MFIPVLDVVDVYRTLHGDQPAFSWFAKGKPQGADAARVDYALVQRPLVDHVVESVYLEEPQERAHSDHAPFVLVLRDMDNIPRPDIVEQTSTVSQETQSSTLHAEACTPSQQPHGHSSTDSLPSTSLQVGAPSRSPEAALDTQFGPTVDPFLSQPEPDIDPSLSSDTTVDPSLQMDPKAFGLLVEQAVAASAAALSS